MVWNGNTTETKMDIAKFISFRFRFFRFVSVFRTFFICVFVSVNGMKIFPLTDISVSVSVNVNHTALLNLWIHLLVMVTMIVMTNNHDDDNDYHNMIIISVPFRSWLRSADNDDDCTTYSDRALWFAQFPRRGTPDLERCQVCCCLMLLWKKTAAVFVSILSVFQVEELEPIEDGQREVTCRCF